MTRTKLGEQPDPRSFLPLKPDLFHILLVLAEEERHGYGIMKAVEETTRGEIRLEPSPLYRRLKRFLEAGIVEEGTGGPSAALGDNRRRYYRLTPFGREVAAAEAARVVELAGNSRVRKLAAAGGTTP
jgi:DNA-binding PadR family transcriptional regulator